MEFIKLLFLITLAELLSETSGKTRSQTNFLDNAKEESESYEIRFSDLQSIIRRKRSIKTEIIVDKDVEEDESDEYLDGTSSPEDASGSAWPDLTSLPFDSFESSDSSFLDDEFDEKSTLSGKDFKTEGLPLPSTLPKIIFKTEKQVGVTLPPTCLSECTTQNGMKSQEKYDLFHSTTPCPLDIELAPEKVDSIEDYDEDDMPGTDEPLSMTTPFLSSLPIYDDDDI